MALRPTVKLTQHRGHRIVTPAAAYPVDMLTMLPLLRDPPEEDHPFIMTSIKQAVNVFEGITGIACINQTWKMTLDRWPGGVEQWWDGMRELPVTELYAGTRGPNYVTLPRFPLSDVSSVITYDEGDNATSVAVDDVFLVDTASRPGRLCLRRGATWPVALRENNAIEITYVAGFGAAAADVPESIKRAVAQIASYLFENRGSGCSPRDALTKSGALQIAAEYVIVRL